VTILGIVVVALGLLAMPGALRPVGRRINPKLWTQMCALALISGAAIFELTALVAAAPPLLKLVGLPMAAHDCQALLGAAIPGGSVFVGSALILAAAIPLLAGRALARARRIAQSISTQLRPADRRTFRGEFELFVVSTKSPIALSVPGHPGRLIVSQGVVDTLNSAQFDALCAHEEVHLRCGHTRYIQLSVAMSRAFVFWPPIRNSVNTLRLGLERWADEEAAGVCPDKRTTLRSALIAVAGATAADEIAAFSSVDGVIDRANALEAAPKRVDRAWWLLLFTPGIVLGLGAAFSLVWWGQRAYCVVGMAVHYTS
jgi:hypothetical protein